MQGFYKNKKVLITGHTGFKGSWLSTWLLMLGADVYGYSKNIPTKPSMFKFCDIAKHLNTTEGNILNHELLSNTIQKIKPDIIFHIAAQAITTEAFINPYSTFENNIMGTASVLEAVRKLEIPCSVISITSDKSYLNKEWVWGYKETDEIGGKDPYSASKAGAEMIIRSYYETYFKSTDYLKIATVRAGNIIGGGDWAKNRIVPDCIRAWQINKEVVIKSPEAIRPWQHVIEPIYGYLLLAKNLYNNSYLNGEAFNFGPNPMEFKTVISLVSTLSEIMKEKEVLAEIKVESKEESFEAEILKLNCEKALSKLGWKPILNIREALELTADWYYECLWVNSNMLNFTQNQIKLFEKKVII